MYKEMSVLLEEGKIGNFELEKFQISKENRPFRCDIPNGKYIRLVNKSNGECVMSDTPMEKRTNYRFLEEAHGDVLIGGLGIGMIIIPIQEKIEVKSITILEKNPEVIELVGKQLPLNNKVTVIEGDIFTYELAKGTKFDSIYFDIWSYINTDVWIEMKALKIKYRKHKQSSKINPNSFIKCWAEIEAKKGYPLR
jgi:hypothetical protein